ncbi:MAG: cell division protein DedD [Tenericutes bacterium]|nr:MAG: cell division protein DedD [Mycoplasmatota bacterium]
MGAKKHERPSWDEYFLEVMHAVSKRANCDRARLGAVIVKDKRIITTGYNGAPAGLATCDEIGHLMKTSYDKRGGEHQHCVRTTHAEANTIAQAARHGTSCNGATLYVKMEPCVDCAKLLINAGIKRVVAWKRYHAAHDSRKMLKDAGVKLEVINDDILEKDD